MLLPVTVRSGVATASRQAAASTPPASANAAWYDALSTSKPAMTGPVTVPASPAIWKNATRMPSWRAWVLSRSPSIADGATSSSPEPAPATASAPR
ncbi:MAG TPA: hypothetical protein VGM12_28400 [Trebonia sp.]